MATNTLDERELAVLEDPKVRRANERRGVNHGINLTRLRALPKELVHRVLDRGARASAVPRRPTAVRFTTALLLVLAVSVHGQAAPEEPAREGAAACSIDLTGDGAVDTVVLFERTGRYRLVALVAEGGGYATHLLREYGPGLGVLGCRQGARLTSTTAGAGSRASTRHTTPGTYVALTFPETSEVAYYWRDGAFVEVWLAD